jgi:hypothetical protein
MRFSFFISQFGAYKNDERFLIFNLIVIIFNIHSVIIRAN